MTKNAAGESRQIFEPSDIRLLYACPSCQTEFIFIPEKSEPASNSARCLMCGEPLKAAGREQTDDIVLWKALTLYREFRRYIDRHGLSLRFVVTESKLNN